MTVLNHTQSRYLRRLAKEADVAETKAAFLKQQQQEQAKETKEVRNEPDKK